MTAIASSSSTSSSSSLVYPALISTVAKAFQEQIQTSIHVKDLLEYVDCFSGKSGIVSFTT